MTGPWLAMVLAASPLQLEEVLESADRAFPALQAQRADAAAAEGELQAAHGVFDPVARVRGTAIPLSGYPSTRLEAVVEQPTPLWGAGFFAGYRYGQGSFPVYYGERATNAGGELRAGASVPLLRNGETDRRRTTLGRAEAEAEGQRAAVEVQRLEVRRLATVRWVDWVVAGRRLVIAESLYELAEVRDAALQRRADAGDLPPIDRTENLRAVLQREGAVVAARRQLEQAALELSLYLRDAEGRPRLPDRARLPGELSPPEVQVTRPGLEALYAARPDVRRLGLLREQLTLERRLAENQQLPALDFALSVTKDFGEGDPKLDKTDLEATLSFEFPLPNRVARGRARAASGALLRVVEQERLLRDRAAVEVGDAESALGAARERVRIAGRELAVATELEKAEWHRFELGEGNLLFVNLREVARAEAAVREVEALADYHKAQAAFRAATAAPLP